MCIYVCMCVFVYVYNYKYTFIKFINSCYLDDDYNCKLTYT